MFELKGKIIFDPINVTKKHNNQSSWKKVAMVKFNCDLSEYYSWFLKKRFNLSLNKPLRGAHFTVINDRIDDVVYEQARNLFNGREITLKFDPNDIRSNGAHWWIKVYSDDAKNIRSVMGLEDPYFGFHLTIGLATHLQLEHSKYIVEQCIRFGI